MCSERSLGVDPLTANSRLSNSPQLGRKRKANIFLRIVSLCVCSIHAVPHILGPEIAISQTRGSNRLESP